MHFKFWLLFIFVSERTVVSWMMGKSEAIVRAPLWFLCFFGTHEKLFDSVSILVYLCVCVCFISRKLFSTPHNLWWMCVCVECEISLLWYLICIYLLWFLSPLPCNEWKLKIDDKKLQYSQYNHAGIYTMCYSSLFCTRFPIVSLSLPLSTSIRLSVIPPVTRFIFTNQWTTSHAQHSIRRFVQYQTTHVLFYIGLTHLISCLFSLHVENSVSKRCNWNEISEIFFVYFTIGFLFIKLLVYNYCGFWISLIWKLNRISISHEFVTCLCVRLINWQISKSKTKSIPNCSSLTYKQCREPFVILVCSTDSHEHIIQRIQISCVQLDTFSF